MRRAERKIRAIWQMQLCRHRRLKFCVSSVWSGMAAARVRTVAASEWEAGSMVDAREGEAGGGEGGEAEGSEAKGWTDGHEAEGGGGERGAARQVAIESALLTATR